MAYLLPGSADISASSAHSNAFDCFDQKIKVCISLNSFSEKLFPLLAQKMYHGLLMEPFPADFHELCIERFLWIRVEIITAMIQSLVLALLILLSLVLFFLPIRQRLSIIRSVKGSFHIDHIDRRIVRWATEVLFQKKVISQRPFAGFMHALVFWGFLAFSLVSLEHFTRGFGGSFLGHGSFYHIFTRIVSVFAVLVILGITCLAVRRFVFRPPALGDHLSWESGLVALFIELLMLTYLIGIFCDGMEVESLLDPNLSFLALANWWIHVVIILAFLVLIPRSKHLHLLFAPFTTFLKPLDISHVEPLDFEKEEFGAETLSDLGPMTALSSFTCVECGRCMDHCPATNSGKKLNPKEFILSLRRGFLKNPASTITDEIIDPDIIWQCTTCGSCTFQCPVGVEHVTPIIETRRGLTAGGIFPSPMKAMFKSLERQRNPWGYPPSQAHDFLSENGYPRYEGQDILYWMGCFARFDDRYRNISLSFIKKMNEAGVSWGVLYDECCTGDAARRAGNEFLYQDLAMDNISKLNETSAKTIVSTCPHCIKALKEYQTLKDEHLRSNIHIIHHSQLLRRLSESNKLPKPVSENKKTIVYHDPCYLSRYIPKVGIADPRAFLSARGLSLVEAARSGVQSFCCGAGGGQFFNEETDGERIYRIRTKELIETGAEGIVTACPFCQSMIRDGLADLGIENISIKDICEC